VKIGNGCGALLEPLRKSTKRAAVYELLRRCIKINAAVRDAGGSAFRLFHNLAGDPYNGDNGLHASTKSQRLIWSVALAGHIIKPDQTQKGRGLKAAPFLSLSRRLTPLG
jgi:hypothetical protein